MPRVDPTYRITKFGIEDLEDLSKLLDKSYEKLATGINTKTDTVVRDDSPEAPLTASSDYDFEIGTKWIDSTLNKAYILTSRPNFTTAYWVEIT